MPKGDFFMVGRDTIHQVLELGITEASAFLVLARGSGGDNITTSWSANAIADRIGVRWSTAKTGLGNLSTSKFIKITGTKARPIYKLARRGEDIWLPNSLIDGLNGAASPVAMVRSSQDALLLRLLIDFYSDQNLREHGGIATSVAYRDYSRQRLGQYGQFVVWGFDPGSEYVYRTPTMEPHYRPAGPELLAQGRRWDVSDLFKRKRTLTSLGLLEEVPMLYESTKGEPIHPVYLGSRIELEARLGDACQSAGIRALSGEHHEILDKKGWPEIVACVPAHIEQVAVIGTNRLIFRPHTALTSAWIANMLEEAPECIKRYEAIAAGESSGAQYA
jgi:hypothetical protein